MCVNSTHHTSDGNLAYDYQHDLIDLFRTTTTNNNNNNNILSLYVYYTIPAVDVEDDRSEASV